MGNEQNLIPLNQRSPEERKRIQMKGARSKSPAKRLAARYNGMLSNKKLTPEQRHLLLMMRDKNYYGVIDELINETLQEHVDPARRDKAVEQLQKMVPTKVMNLNIETVIPPSEVFDVDAHLDKLFGKEKKK